MDEIFKVFTPETVRELVEELFTGYINSPMCSAGYLGDMYELKRLVNDEVDKQLKKGIMESEINITLLSSRLSGGELKLLQRLASKPSYSEKETKFILAMANRIFKKDRNSIALEKVTIKPEGSNFLIISNPQL